MDALAAKTLIPTIPQLEQIAKLLAAALHEIDHTEEPETYAHLESALGRTGDILTALHSIYEKEVGT